jgi:hypothetical protein
MTKESKKTNSSDVLIPLDYASSKKSSNGTRSRPSDVSNLEGEKERRDAPPMNSGQNQKRKAGLPVVSVLHDSVLRDVSARGLGQRYGLNVIKMKTPTVDSIKSSMDAVQAACEKPPEAVVFHCGINDLRRADPQAVSNAFVNAVKEARKVAPHAQLVISRVPPVKSGRDTALQAKRDLFNAYVFARLMDEKNVTFLAHENLFASSMRDSIHPNAKGASVLATNIGRYLESVLWKRPRRPAYRGPMEMSPGAAAAAFHRRPFPLPPPFLAHRAPWDFFY